MTSAGCHHAVLGCLTHSLLTFITIESSFMSIVTIIHKNRLKTKVISDVEVKLSLDDALAKDRLAMRLRLDNWGRWQRVGNNAEIDRDTGQIKVSMSGYIIKFAPIAEPTGFYDPIESLDEVDAELLDDLVKQLCDAEKSLLNAFYRDRMSQKFLADYMRKSIRSVQRDLAAIVDKLLVVG